METVQKNMSALHGWNFVLQFTLSTNNLPTVWSDMNLVGCVSTRGITNLYTSTFRPVVPSIQRPWSSCPLYLLYTAQNGPCWAGPVAGVDDAQ